MDTRGHGRSPLTSPSFSYSTFTQDVVALLDLLKIDQIAIVGWSDGAVTGLELAFTRPGRVSRLFAFGASSTVAGLKRNGASAPVFVNYTNRCKSEYVKLSPHPERWPQLVAGLQVMWRTEPNFTTQHATVSAPTTISYGEYDEIIRRADTERMAHTIAGARFLIQPRVSHFGMLQDPKGFNSAVTKFLQAP
jgi:pimeloyl-ACP methyl ester carboxylesterase